MKEKYFFLKLRVAKDPDAFGELYNIYVDQIFRFIYFKVSRKEEAEDLTAEVFLKTWQYINEEKAKKIDNLKAFLYQTARNSVIDFYRKKNPTENLFIEQKNENDEMEENWSRNEIVDSKKNPLEEMQLNSDVEGVKKALQKLKEEYREAILLKFVEEMSISEIANILGKKKGAVRVLLHRAIQSLRTVLEVNKGKDCP
ncbi:MAG TPA: RNA polymerase sigma factor [Patescibacteria group bacterium]|nr:RNA polymerase sigma factor [Patescibacteria group bacterium]